MARGTTGAPRNTPGSDPGVSASGGDTGTDQETRGNETKGARARRPAQPSTQARSGGVGRLISIVCGRRSKYLVVAFWVLMVVILGSLAGKLQGAEKNDSSAYLPSSAESTQELNEQAVFQNKNYNPALVVYVRESGITAADLAKAQADARRTLALAPDLAEAHVVFAAAQRARAMPGRERGRLVEKEQLCEAAGGQ